MRKRTSSGINKKDHRKSRSRPSKQKISGAVKHMENEEDAEDLRESVSLESEDIQPNTTTNWSQAQDRSEDFANETDPFIQESEKMSRIPRDNRL